MDQGLIPRRYAKALLLVANERQCSLEVYEAMTRLEAAFDAEPQLSGAMSNPAVSAPDKLALVTTSCGTDAGTAAGELLADFVKLLERNRRLELVRQTALAYIDEYRRVNKIYSVVVSAPQPLQPAELRRIEDLVKAHLPEGSTPEFATTVNPDLIGGFTISIDNELLDASVATELKQIRLKLLSH